MCDAWVRGSSSIGGCIMGALVGCALFFIVLVVVTAVVEGFDLL